MDYYIIIYIIFGVLPSLTWLSYYLRKDVHPEPKKMVLKIFLWGALITIPVFFVQIGLAKLLTLGIDIQQYVTSGDIVLKKLTTDKNLVKFYKAEGCSDTGLLISFKTKAGEELKGTCNAATSDIISALLKNKFEYIGAFSGIGTAF